MKDVDMQNNNSHPEQKNIGAVDATISAVTGEWKFNHQVAENFDTHVEKSVPYYHEIQRMIVEMSEWFVGDYSVIYDIGSSTGETISLLLEKNKNKKDVKFVGIENCNAMIEKAKIKCDSLSVNFVYQDALELTGFINASLITSLYTLHFIPFDRRLELLKMIHRDLRVGGAFILVEKVHAESSLFEDMWLELHWDSKKRQGLDDSMIIQKARSLRGVLMPLSLSEYLKILGDIGYTKVEVFSKWYNWVGIIATKGI